MQIESLKVFCDLAETESFTKAAQINAVTQSAVSQQISSLERTFKSLLIERSKKKFRLTREGQVLYDYSKQIIQTYESLHSKLQELKDIISGTIRVATIYSIGSAVQGPIPPSMAGTAWGSTAGLAAGVVWEEATRVKAANARDASTFLRSGLFMGIRLRQKARESLNQRLRILKIVWSQIVWARDQTSLRGQPPHPVGISGSGY